MKFMILVKATKDSEAGVMPTEKLIAEMTGFHEEMAKAGILVDGAGLRPSPDGWRIRYGKDGKRSWSTARSPRRRSSSPATRHRREDPRRGDRAGRSAIPNPSIDGGAAEIEVRPFFEMEDFGDSPAAKRGAEIGLQK